MSMAGDAMKVIKSRIYDEKLYIRDESLVL